MRLGTFLIFVTIVVTAAALSVIPPRKDKADTDTLELVQIVSITNSFWAVYYNF